MPACGEFVESMLVRARLPSLPAGDTSRNKRRTAGADRTTLRCREFDFVSLAYSTPRESSENGPDPLTWPPNQRVNSPLPTNCTDVCEGDDEQAWLAVRFNS